MAGEMNRQILLASRPEGMIKESDFSFQEAPIPEPGENQILVKNLYLSLDPAMRGWMSDMDSYIEPVAVGGVMRGGTIGKVVKSNHAEYKEGDKVFGLNGWQEFGVVGPDNLPNKLPEGLPIPLTSFMSVLGATGLTAYFGLLDIGQPKEGDTVVVSTAAGAVGSIVGQIAKIKGCRVVGLTGSDEKCAWITQELGYDAAINYKSENIAEALRRTCPDKIDVYFDNVGGEILNEVLGQINVGASICICGAISRYNETEPTPGPSNYLTLLTKRSRMEGFVILDYFDRFMEGIQQLSQWVIEGKLKHREHIIEGLENAPKAINLLFEGKNTGKLIIKIADE